MNTQLITLRHPLLVLHLSMWLIYIIVDSFDHIKSGYYDLFPSIFCGFSACVLTGIVALIAMRYEEDGIKKQGAIFAVCLLFATIVWHKIFAILHRLTDTSIAEEINKLFELSLSGWLQTGYMPLFLFIAWAGLFVASKWYLETQKQELQLNEVLLQAKQAQLQALRYQLNPHFLFNVLNNIDVSILHEDKQTAHLMVTHLSQFLRNNLERGEQSKVTLLQELEMLNDYIAIEKLRFKEAIAITQQIDTACLQAMLPPMLLQPLMENAIKFAWDQQQQGGISLVVDKTSNVMNIKLSNSKFQSVQPHNGTGKGLRNVQDRLQLIYGDDATFCTMDKAETFDVILELPLEVSLRLK